MLTINLKTIRVSCAFFCAITLSSIGQTATPPEDPRVATYQAYINKAKGEVEQYKLEVEKTRTMQMQFRAQRDDKAAARQDVTIKQYQNILTLKQAELGMYTQAISAAKQAKSQNPTIAAMQLQIDQMNFEKSRMGITQIQANQSGNQAQAAQISKQMQTIQLQIAAKQQEIKLAELQMKTGRN